MSFSQVKEAVRSLIATSSSESFFKASVIGTYLYSPSVLEFCIDEQALSIVRSKIFINNLIIYKSANAIPAKQIIEPINANVRIYGTPNK